MVVSVLPNWNSSPKSWLYRLSRIARNIMASYNLSQISVYFGSPIYWGITHYLASPEYHGIVSYLRSPLMSACRVSWHHPLFHIAKYQGIDKYVGSPHISVRHVCRQSRWTSCPRCQQKSGGPRVQKIRHSPCRQYVKAAYAGKLLVQLNAADITLR